MRVFAGSPLTINFGLSCRDHTIGGNAFTSATFSKCLWFRLRAVVFNLRVVFLFSRGREKLLINIFIIAFRFYISYMCCSHFWLQHVSKCIIWRQHVSKHRQRNNHKWNSVDERRRYDRRRKLYHHKCRVKTSANVWLTYVICKSVNYYENSICV